MLRSMCTPWKTWRSGEPATASTPLERKMSTPFSRKSRESQSLSLARSSSPSRSKPTLETVLSCWCSPSTSRKASSISRTRPRSKAPIPSTSSKGARENCVSITAAYLLISRTRATTAAFSASSTKSILLSRIRSAKATCSTDSFSTPSGFSSFRCSTMCFASTTVRMPSSRIESLISSSTKKVWATGAGSARPVVSIRI
mmetsp:Transcript_4574/g.15773  ORF Transcript_4574/g.15773 Transcript_4574/m.15773 type:complete len:200 (-) Transcript_4574:332-931(-)